MPFLQVAPAPAPTPAAPAAPAPAALVMDIEEGKYNARDVLGMCRAYRFLIAAVERTNTTQVYEIDRAMATLALQMTRCGMPVDLEEKERVGKKLRGIQQQAIVDLRPFTQGEFRETFIGQVALLTAAKARKKDPKVGEPDPQAHGQPYSNETALNARIEIRKQEFVAKFERAELAFAVRTGDSTAMEHVSEIGKAALRAIGRKLDKERGQPLGTHTADHPDVIEILCDRYEKKGLNFGAKVQQAALLRAAGVPLTKVTEKQGLPKISKETLEEFGYHPSARAMLNYILTTAALRTFIDGLEIDADGRMRPDWSIMKITGRWGSSPNVQNWSKRAGGGAENLRRMVAAPPGMIFVGADQKQLEARIIAADSQDPFLLDVFRRNADIHGELAGVWTPSWPRLAETYAKHKPLHKNIKSGGIGCGLTVEQPYCDLCAQRDKVRDLTKRLEYGAFYGGSVDTLWKSVVKDFPELKPAAIAQFLITVGQRMPGVLQWRANRLKEAIENGEIRSPILGRREVFPLGRVEPTVAYNYIPQSGGADLWAIGAVKFMAKWDQTSDDARVCHNGHDSVLILCKEEYADAVEEDVHECWEMEFAGVPFLMDCKRGRRWSEV
jgi:DNA polymerase I-like protein with 3'-5' exonuclease and polymerase domains